MTSATMHPPPTPTPTPQEVRMKLAIPDISPSPSRSRETGSPTDGTTERRGSGAGAGEGEGEATMQVPTSPRSSKSRSMSSVQNGVSSLMRIAMPSHRPVANQSNARDKASLQSIAENFPPTPAADSDVPGDESDDEEALFSPEAELGVSQETTIHSGYLLKKGERRKTWKKRWFALRSSKLAYYKSDKEYRLLRLISMADVRTITPIPYKYENVFGIVTASRTFYVQASSAKEMNQWMGALQRVKEAHAHNDQARESGPVSKIGSDPETVATSASPEASSSRRTQPIDITSRQGESNNRPSGSRNASSSPPVSRSTQPRATMSSYTSQSTDTTANSFVDNPILARNVEFVSNTTPGFIDFSSHYGASNSTSASASRFPSAGTSITSPPSTTLASGTTTPQYGTGARGGNPPPPPPNSLTGSYAQAAGPTSRAVGHLSPIAGWSEEDALSRGAFGSPAQDYFSTRRANRGGDISPTSPTFHDRSDHMASSSDEDDDASDVDENIDTAAAVTPGGRELGLQAHERPYDPEKVVTKGYLMKQGKRKNWRKRWFVLTQNRLMYFKSDKERKLHRQILVSRIVDAIEYEPKLDGQNRPRGESKPSALSPQHQHGFAAVFGGVSTPGPQSHATSTNSGQHAADSVPMSRGQGSLDPHKRKQFCIKIITPKRTYLVGAPTEEDEIHWLSSLQAVLARHRVSGSSSNRTSVVTPGALPHSPSASPPSAPAPQLKSQALPHRGEPSHGHPVAMAAPGANRSPVVRPNDTVHLPSSREKVPGLSLSNRKSDPGQQSQALGKDSEDLSVETLRVD